MNYSFIPKPQMNMQNTLHFCFNLCLLQVLSHRMSSVTYLGYVFSSGGMYLDPEKVSAICSWATPTDVSLLRSFLGLASNNRCFIHQFANIAAPLYSQGYSLCMGPIGICQIEVCPNVCPYSQILKKIMALFTRQTVFSDYRSCIFTMAFISKNGRLTYLSDGLQQYKNTSLPLHTERDQRIVMLMCYPGRTTVIHQILLLPLLNSLC